MILRKIDYHEFEGEANYWDLKGLTLEKVNLLVGKNATGKTNTITKIVWLGNMLAGFQPPSLNSGNYYAEFEDEKNRKYQYKLDILQSKVQQETLSIDGKPMFNRDINGEGTIVTEQYPEPMRFKLSPNELVVFFKRDAAQHPYLNKLSDWANGMRAYAFGSSLGKDSAFPVFTINQELVVDTRNPNQIAGLYAKGKEDFGNDFEIRIKSHMKELDYELSNIDIDMDRNIKEPVQNGVYINMALYICEEGSTATVYQAAISQGMFRALSLIILLTYNILKELPTTVLIDDIGEGLDFDRSTKLVKLLIELAEENNIQLIMSTNDRFVMNAVPLKYWQVIQRKGGECQVFNYHNSKEKFDEFEYTGLNNFDFLRTDFLNSKWGPV
jgi:AAA15 family ATPase/GTPase